MPSRNSIFRYTLFAAVGLVYLTGLAQIGVFGPDEPRYSAIGVEMAHSGDWITPRLWGHPWFEKSPLLYWMTGAATLLGFGPENAPRLPVALTAFALIVFLYWFLKPRLGCGIALHSSILLAGSAGWIAFGSVGVTDIPLAADTTACILLVVFGGPAWLAGVFLGLAALAKGLVPFVLFLPLVWWLYREKRLKELFPIGLACLVIAGPWYTAVTLRHGHAFFDEFIIKHHFARFANDSLQHVRPVWFYIPALVGALFPWSGLLPFIARRDVLIDVRLRFLGVWVLFGFVFLSLSKNKLPGYILPLVPALCILMAAALERIPSVTGRILAVTTAVMAALGLQILPALPGILADGWNKTAVGPFQIVPLFVGMAAGAACWWIVRSGRQTVLLSSVLALVLAGVLWIKFGGIATGIDRLATARPVARTAAKDGCVHPNDRDLRFGLSYYWGFEVPECNDDTLPKRIRRSGSF